MCRMYKTTRGNTARGEKVQGVGHGIAHAGGGCMRVCAGLIQDSLQLLDFIAVQQLVNLQPF